MLYIFPINSQRNDQKSDYSQKNIEFFARKWLTFEKRPYKNARLYQRYPEKHQKQYQA